MTPLDLPTLLVLALATFRVTRLVTTDTVLSRPREWLWSKFPPESSWLGYLVSCDWCTGVWVGSTFAVAHTIVPTVTYPIALALALAAVAGILAARH
jgi:hypothetical protein